jgi:hypothetical protein
MEGFRSSLAWFVLVEPGEQIGEALALPAFGFGCCEHGLSLAERGCA